MKTMIASQSLADIAGEPTRCAEEMSTQFETTAYHELNEATTLSLQKMALRFIVLSEDERVLVCIRDGAGKKALVEPIFIRLQQPPSPVFLMRDFFVLLPL
jgi:hypothetical protein